MIHILLGNTLKAHIGNNIYDISKWRDDKNYRKDILIVVD